jgi:hypothetical protein
MYQIVFISYRPTVIDKEPFYIIKKKLVYTD